MKRLKIGIRPQLIILVCFSSLFSLLILAIVTGLYFTQNLSDLRAERLQVISQLKTTQVQQSFDYLFYQVYWLATKDTITQPLTSYRAGNNSQEIFGGAQSTLDQFLSSSELFAAARVYNLDLLVVASSYNNATAVSQPAQDFLFPLSANASLPTTLTQQTQAGTIVPFFTGPISNNTNVLEAYFMGITLPIYSNTSIILHDPALAGYITVLCDAASIRLAINDTATSGSNSTKDYNVLAVTPIMGGINTTDYNEIIGFETIFPVGTSDSADELVVNAVYNINSSSLIKEALTKSTGSSANVRSYSGQNVAIGFTQIQLDSDTIWSIIIEQPRSTFLEPVKKLRNIIIGVVIGIGVAMCLITFPLAVWFIRPITKLKEATEAITKSKKRMKLQANTNSSSSITSSSNHPPPYGSYKKESHPNKDNTSYLGKRNSVNSVLTNNSSAFSDAILLPSKITSSKKFFKDELTELSEAFNIMTEELDKQYTHLEDRVKLRTKELEASKIEAESANEAKTVFIANISHELRTPLNGILGMTSIAMDEEDQTRIQDSLKLIHRSGELLLHILTELLTYSKNTLNRSKLEKSNFQILEVVYQVKSIFSKLALDQRVNFKVLVKPNVIRKLILYGDSNRIIQIVMNLVSNSLKFTPVDGSVDVTFRLLGEYDSVQSEADNYSKVHILKHTHSESNGSSGDTLTNNVTKSNFVNDATAPDSGIELRSLSSSDKHDDDDTLSITTISTTEYEKKIFESQFNHYKPLPTLPSSRHKRPRNENGSFLPPPGRNNSGTMITKTSTKEDSFETANDSSFSSGKQSLPRPSIVPSDHNTWVSKSMDGYVPYHMSESELVKNNKAFKIRNIYKPRTWAIQVEVTDTGPGIEPALQEKVFEPFIQGDQTLSRSYGGTGLGLSICRQLATMMRGTLSLKSSVGVGSTFIFTVPLPQTGEILVNPKDMTEFCEDEFNPKSKMNRKVAFDHLAGGVPKTKSESSNQTDVCEPSIDKTEPSDQDSTSDSSSKPRIEIHESELDDQNSSHKIGPSEFSRASLFEKPRLISRSSTGTANSVSNQSDRSDSHRSILDDLSHLRILVAEDNMVNQEVIKRMLKLEGFTDITMACNGEEAVEFVKDSLERLEIFDMIFMDVQMPKMDGHVATKVIRNELHYDKPIIALTAFADESNVKECLNSGMTGFLSKPIRRNNLRKVIVEFSPIILSEVVTTPQTYSGEEKRLGYGNNYVHGTP